MTEKEEEAYLEGKTKLAHEILQFLKPNLPYLKTTIQYSCMVEETRAVLRGIKEEYGLDFPDDLYTPDILNKHIIPLIEAAEDERKRQRGTE